jgi:hypothetical protein
LIFGVEEYPNEGYFDTLKIVEDVFRIKMRVEMTYWHIDCRQAGKEERVSPNFGEIHIVFEEI